MAEQLDAGALVERDGTGADDDSDGTDETGAETAVTVEMGTETGTWESEDTGTGTNDNAGGLRLLETGKDDDADDTKNSTDAGAAEDGTDAGTDTNETGTGTVLELQARVQFRAT